MSRRANDRRVHKTRAAVHAALVALMLDKPYEEITVQEIIDRGDVGRSTFYAHFLDKDDVLVQGFVTVLDAAILPVSPGEGRGLAVPLDMACLIRHAQEHLPLYQALVRRQGLDRLKSIGHDHLRRELVATLLARVSAENRNMNEVAFAAEVVAASAMSALLWALGNGLPYTPEAMDAMFQRMMGPGLGEILGV